MKTENSLWSMTGMGSFFDDFSRASTFRFSRIAIAALITGRVGEGWLMETRRWALVAWGFLTVGIILGGWWAYEVLGWGGVWAWDPVENAAFMFLVSSPKCRPCGRTEVGGILNTWPS